MSQEMLQLSPNSNLELHAGITHDSDLFPLPAESILSVLRLKQQNFDNHSIKVEVQKPQKDKQNKPDSLGFAYIAINENILEKIQSLLSQAEAIMDGELNLGPKTFDTLTGQIESILHGSIVNPASMLHFPN